MYRLPTGSYFTPDCQTDWAGLVSDDPTSTICPLGERRGGGGGGGGGYVNTFIQDPLPLPPHQLLFPYFPHQSSVITLPSYPPAKNPTNISCYNAIRNFKPFLLYRLFMIYPPSP